MSGPVHRPTGTAPRSLGKILRFKREQSGWTAEQLAERLGERGDPLFATRVHRIESGEERPDPKRVDLLLELFDLPAELVEDLLELESKGIEIPEPTDYATMLLRAHAAWSDGDPDEGMAWFLALQHLCRDADPRSERMQTAVLAFAQGIARDGRLQAARRILDRVLLVGFHPNLRARAYVFASQVWLHSGNLDAAAAFLDRALEAASPGDRVLFATALHQRAHVQALERRTEEADESLAHALRHYAKTDRRRGETTARLLRVRILRAAGRHDEALDQAQDVVRRAREFGFDRTAISATIQVARTLVESGRAGPAVGHLQQALAESIDRGYRAQTFDARANLWRAYRALGDEQRAREALESAGALAEFLEFGEPDVVEVRQALEELDRPAGRPGKGRNNGSS